VTNKRIYFQIWHRACKHHVTALAKGFSLENLWDSCSCLRQMGRLEKP